MVFSFRERRRAKTFDVSAAVYVGHPVSNEWFTLAGQVYLIKPGSATQGYLETLIDLLEQ
jgi:hypothetical protein